MTNDTEQVKHLVALHSVENGYEDYDEIREAVHKTLDQCLSRQEGSESLFHGKKILIKPNFVYHENHGSGGIECVLTHPHVLCAVLEKIVEHDPGQIIIGDSPIQLADWDRVFPQSLRETLLELAGNIPCELIDFRRTTAVGDDISDGLRENQHSMDQYVQYDLKKTSMLEPVTGRRTRFRITNYDPRIIAAAHRPGMHQYVLCRAAMESDVVVSVPKLKTHRKAGMTCALKNLVGLNGNKEILPHHRYGGTWTGGDCYPGLDPLKRLKEWFLDVANRNIGTENYRKWRDRVMYMDRLRRRFRNAGTFEGSWYGNDTCWRMVLDLNRLLLFGRADGSLADTPQRHFISIADAILIGEGEGPMQPDPLACGMILASASPAALDWTAAQLIGIDPRGIPLLRYVFGDYQYPIASYMPDDIRVSFNSNSASIDDIVDGHGVHARMPLYWKEYEQNIACKRKLLPGQLSID